MHKIVPCLWFDDQAEEATNFYVSLFQNSRVLNVTRYGEAAAGASGRPKGTVLTVTFQLEGQDFMGLNGGPVFRFTPAVSFFVSCRTRQEIDTLWSRLSEGGTVLMELDSYPFSERFGWLNDRFGVSWELNLKSRAQAIAPALMFVGRQHGRAEEALDLYVSSFPNSAIVYMERWGEGEGEPEGTVKHAVFSLNGQEFMAMENSGDHRFTFTPAISLVVSCQTQEEIDHFWNRLSEGGDEAAQQCGWLQDRFGVSWQIVPTVLDEMLQGKDAARSERVWKALLSMKKLDIEGLRRAYER